MSSWSSTHLEASKEKFRIHLKIIQSKEARKKHLPSDFYPSLVNAQGGITSSRLQAPPQIENVWVSACRHPGGAVEIFILFMHRFPDLE